LFAFEDIFPYVDLRQTQGDILILLVFCLLDAPGLQLFIFLEFSRLAILTLDVFLFFWALGLKLVVSFP